MKKYLLVLLLFVIGCETAQLLSVGEITLTTDKELYHSGEIIHITANVNSPIILDNATIRFYGIHSRRYRLDQTKTVDLHEGENTITLDYQAPRCYGCAGIKPGTYKISADCMHNGQTLANTSVDIEIR